MKNRSPEVDAYLAGAADFARPILVKIRKLFHKACPKIQETMKWSFPHFECKGIVGSMAAFKRHVSWGFWKAGLLRDPHKLLVNAGNGGMSTFKLADVADLPADSIILPYIREAVALNEKGVKVPAKATARKELVVPAYFVAALKKNKKARATFDAFSYSHKKEYVEWIAEAKQAATRQRRIATALEWLAEGKDKNWKYRDC